MNAHSCSTFLLSLDDDWLVGHNLDYIETPGLMVVNKRGIAKYNLSWDSLRIGPITREPNIQWISRYSSITYNPMGKVFPDGGMNEAGLYVGEMTFFGTNYPGNPDKPKFYYQLWIQYLLDNMLSVGEVLANLGTVFISGFKQWHFFIADRNGQNAVIEFLEGKQMIHAGTDMLHPVLCNRSYECDVVLMSQTAPFGGDECLPFDTCEDDPPFACAAAMPNRYTTSGSPAEMEYSFTILKQLDCGNNLFSILCDFRYLRIYFQTHRARTIRYADFSFFDFSPDAPTMILDIHQPLSGDVAGHLMPFTEKPNTKNLHACLNPIKWDS